MQETRRRTLLGGAAALAAAPAMASKTAMAPGIDLVVAVPDDLATLDPANASFTLDQSVGRLFVQGLLGFDGNMKVKPLLAESGTSNGYVFGWAPPGSRYKACHCIDLPFVFGNFGQWGDPGMLHGGSAAEMAALSGVVRRAWIGFVRDGVPEPDPLICWPRYEPDGKPVIRLGQRIWVGHSCFV